MRLSLSSNAARERHCRLLRRNIPANIPVTVPVIAMGCIQMLDRFFVPDVARLVGAERWLLAVQSGEGGSSSYFTIEGMRGQEFSIGIFIFMLIGVLVFVAIILRFVLMARKESKLKTGEKVMFAWIIFGTIVAVIFGGLQLLSGRLF